MTADSEDAETYLRLLAETELRRAARSALYSWRDYRHRVHYAAGALVTVGAIAGPVADSIARDLEAALALRNPDRTEGLTRPQHRSVPMLPAVTSRPAPPAPVAPWGIEVTAAGQMFRLHDEEAPANLWVLSVVRTPASTRCAVAALMQGATPNISYALHIPRLLGLDDQGRRYSAHYSGQPGEATADGWLSIHPVLPDGVRWIEFYSYLEAPRMRLDLTAGSTPAQVAVDPADPASPGERLLDAIAIGMLTREPEAGLGRSLDEIVTALEVGHALPPGSLALSRLAAVCYQAPRLAAALKEGELPAAELPEPWTSVLAHSIRRHKPAVKPGVAPLAVILPELDGITFVLAGLRSEADHSVLSVVAGGLPQDAHGHRLGFQWSQWFPWFIRDSAGQWHIAQVDGEPPGWRELATLHLRVVPPLPRSVTRLDVVITGRSARITATVPVTWATGS